MNPQVYKLSAKVMNSFGTVKPLPSNVQHISDVTTLPELLNIKTQYFLGCV